MGLVYVAASLMAMVALSYGDEMVQVENKTYASVTYKGDVSVSKQMNISADSNALKVMPKTLMNKNSSGAALIETTIADKNFTLVASASASEVVDSNRVVATMTEVNSGTITMHVDVFKAAGNVTIDGETTVVKEGDMRITLQIADYAWDDNSQMLDFTFSVKGKENPSMQSNDPTTDGLTYSLGENGMIKLSKKTMAGSTFDDIDPTVSSDMVTISFNKTTETTYTYKFFLTPADLKDDDKTNSGSRVTSLGFIVLLMTCLHVMLL